jgi:GAF domain-containing protein
MDGKDLKAHFDDLFSGMFAEPDEEPAKKGDAALDKLVADLLEAVPEPVAAAPTAAEPATLEFITTEAVIAELVAAPVVEEPVVPQPVIAAPPVAAPEPAALAPVAEPVAAEEIAAPIVEPIAPKPVVEPALAPSSVIEEEREVKPEPLAWEVQLQEQRTRILNTLLSVTAGVATVIIVTLVLFSLKQPSLWQRYMLFFVSWAALLGLALARRLNTTLRTAILVGLAYVAGTLSLVIDGPLGSGGLYLLLAPLLFSILIQQRAAAYAAGASFVIYVALAIAHHQGWLRSAEVLDINQWDVVLNLGATFTMLLVASTLIQWLFSSALTTALREAQRGHSAALHSQTLLQERADELASANALLQRRTLQLQATALVSSTAALSALDPDALMQQVVDSIHDQLSLQHVGLFLTDETGERAVLQAGTGEAAPQMLAHRYSIVVDPYSAVGWCMVDAQARITPDVKAITLVDAIDPARVTQLLPDTQSEIVLPLRSRGRLLGALNLRSTQPNAFSADDVPILQTMADQIAVAIDNAQSFARVQANLREFEEAQRQYVRERWSRFLPTQATPTYERTLPGVEALGSSVPPEVEQAMSAREIVVQPDSGDGGAPAALVAPITLRGEVIGVLGLHDAQDGREWTADEIALIRAIADQMSLAIENARLLEETQQRAERERLIADITTRVRTYMDLEGIMQTAVRELGAALGADRAFIRLSATGAQPPEKASLSDETCPLESTDLASEGADGRGDRDEG